MTEENKARKKAEIALLNVLHAPVLSRKAYMNLLNQTSKNTNKYLLLILEAIKYVFMQLFILIASLLVGFVFVAILHFTIGRP
jgi:hypothetical protein